MIPFANAHIEIGIKAQPNASENGPEPNEPKARDIGPPQDDTNLIIRVNTPAARICTISITGPNR